MAMNRRTRFVAVFELQDWERLTPEATAEMFKRASEMARQIGGSSLAPRLAEFRIEAEEG